MLATAQLITLLLTASAAYAAPSRSSDVGSATRLIIREPKLQRYCWDWINRTPHPEVVTITRTRQVAVDRTRTLTQLRTAGTVTVTPRTTTTVGASTLTTVSATTTATATSTINQKRDLPTALPELEARSFNDKPRGEPAALAHYYDPTAYVACQQAYRYVQNHPRTVYTTRTRFVPGSTETIVKRKTVIRTRTADERTKTITDDAVVATTTAFTTTTAAATASATAYNFAVRQIANPGAVVANINVDGTGSLTYNGGASNVDSHSIFIPTTASGSPLSRRAGAATGYFQHSSNPSTCLSTNSYGGTLQFTLCGNSPQIFQLSAGGFVSIAGNAGINYPITGFSNNAVAFSGSSPNGLSFAAGNAL